MRLLILIFVLLVKLPVFSQEQITLADSILPNTKGNEKTPLKLIDKLIAGKNTEKEKFDAIFTWVTKNIKYNYYAYLAPTGSVRSRVDWILKYKTGICIDYAYLMDTLCQLAGIKNISVYGYAKDNLFDVNDSIYMDNHAWNAVKLNNFWYLYDVTWSSGEYKWSYTKFSERIFDLKKKILLRKKEKTINFKSIYTRECDTTKNMYSKTYYTLSRKNRIILKLLSKFKIKKKRVFTKVTRPDYYLSNPEIFAITHFPDNPYWSLITTQESIKTFESDSAYYHLNDSVYIKQKRGGRTCPECDNYFSLDEMNKEKQMRKNSLAFNKRNKFVLWLCDYNISDIYYNKAIPENDSLKKISLIDSSLTHLYNGKNELYQCLLNVHAEAEQQKIKNSNKEHILYEENRKHSDFIHSIVISTYNETRKMDYFSKQSKTQVRKFRYKKSKLYSAEAKVRIKSKNFKPKEKIIELEAKLKTVVNKTDSINLVIDNLISSYNNTLSLLSDNIWRKIKIQDSLSSPFYIGGFYRWFYLLDNYKKHIVEQRKKINKYETEYITNLSADIFTLSDSCSDFGFRIINLIEKRNNLIVESEKLLNILISENAIKLDSLKKFVKINGDKIQDNICWIVGNSSKLNSVLTGYKMLVRSEKEIEGAISSEIRTEIERYKMINNEIYRRKRKFRSIPIHNLRITSKKLNFILKYKREYLKSLRLERRKSLKKKSLKN